jgi:hypothetical protein
MDSIEKRIAELERNVARLMARLNLEAPTIGPQSLPPQRAEEREVSIKQVADVSSYPMPDEQEAQRLYEIVLQRNPRLRKKPDPMDRFILDNDPTGFRQFYNALCFVGSLGRASEPCSKFAVNWWINHCNEWLVMRGLTKVEVVGSFIAAVIAAGDVGIVYRDENAGIPWEFCLEPYSGGLKATDGWRNVLNGQFFQPVRPRHPAPPSPPQIRVVG